MSCGRFACRADELLAPHRKSTKHPERRADTTTKEGVRGTI